MDTILLGYILQKLDRLQDTQRDHGDILGRLLKTTVETETAPCGRSASRWMKLPFFWRMVAGGVVSWGTGTAISSYLGHGGDPMVLVETFMKSLF